ncbi:hypothetical protein I6F26_34030 [Ensifer sp. IC3342]|nr:hypothetical protein [Ensifer sp. BRP08]MCA1451420.1 hypothetical protein [Ensifer sp. IC3342]
MDQQSKNCAKALGRRVPETARRDREALDEGVAGKQSPIMAGIQKINFEFSLLRSIARSRNSWLLLPTSGAAACAAAAPETAEAMPSTPHPARS